VCGSNNEGLVSFCSSLASRRAGLLGVLSIDMTYHTLVTTFFRPSMYHISPASSGSVSTVHQHYYFRGGHHKVCTLVHVSLFCSRLTESTGLRAPRSASIPRLLEYDFSRKEADFSPFPRPTCEHSMARRRMLDNFRVLSCEFLSSSAAGHACQK